MTYVPGRSLSLAEMHLLGNNVRGVVLRDRRAARAQESRNDEEPYVATASDDGEETDGQMALA